jgi:hypothetical protein
MTEPPPPPHWTELEVSGEVALGWLGGIAFREPVWGDETYALGTRRSPHPTTHIVLPNAAA